MYTYSRITPISVFGEVDIKVFDKEDLVQMDPKISILTENTTSNYLLGALTDLMHGNTTSQSSIQLTTDSGWFTGRYAGDRQNYSTTDRHEEDGILAMSSVNTGVVGEYGGSGTENINHFFLYQSMSTPTPGSTDKHVTWTAQSSWGYAATTTISGLEIGKDYNAGSQQPDTTFDTKEFATADSFTNFNLETGDILKVTWTMTIG
jgi:hypothetical protein